MVNFKIIPLLVFYSFLISCFINLSGNSQTFPVSDFDLNLQNPIAFPGAEGFGKYATGGRGGQVIKVTNLNDSGPGSLRAAIEVRGPRIIVFEVSGNIKLKSDLRIRDGNITIAGQTAPGDGITLQDHPLKVFNVNNVIIRFIRSRLGDVLKVEGDAFDARNVKNMIVDHCSFSWGTDEVCSVYEVENVTIQRSIISEGLNRSISIRGDHGYGSLLGGSNLSFYKNLMAHFKIRSPSLTSNSLLTDLRNNVIYNWERRSTDNGSMAKANFYANFYKPGPATNARPKNELTNQKFLWPTSANGNLNSYGKFYLEGNRIAGLSSINSNQWSGVQLENSDLTEKYLERLKNKDLNGNLVPFFIPENLYSYTKSAEDAYLDVLEFAGASLSRDAIDNRLVQETRNGTTTYKGSKTGIFGIIDSQTDVRGWPSLKSLPPLVDTDGDGMPDIWEISNNLDAKQSNDKEYNLNPYYTDIEVYINSIVDDLTQKQYPSTPLTVTPLLPIANANNIAPMDISFAWQGVPNADIYQVQISKSPTFNTGNITLNNIKNYSVLQSKLDANSTYFWRVRAVRNGVSGQYSSIFSFKTGTITDLPKRTVLLQPIPNSESISLSPIFSWAKVPNSTSYQIQVSTASNFSTTIINKTGLTETNFQSLKLAENKTYFWRVRAVNSSGVGSFSETGSFKTAFFGTLPNALIPIRPTNNIIINPVNVLLEWRNESTAESYGVQVSTSSSFSSFVINSSGVSTTFLDISNLNPNTTYYWRVFGENRSGKGWTEYSTFRTSDFTQTPSAIGLLLPQHDSNIFSSSIQFQWTPNPIAQSYRLQVSTTPNFSSLVTNISSIKGNSQTVNNLSRNQDLYWRIQGSNNAGTGIFSEVRKVRAATFSGPPPAIKLISPANQTVLGSSKIMFSWENQPNTENYRLDISDRSDFSTIVFRENAIKGTSFSVEGLQANKTYFWRIHPSNPGGWGPYSSIWTFNAINSNISLSPPTLILPQNATNFGNSNLNFSWQRVGDAVDYQIQISEKADFSSLVYQNQSINNTNLNLSSLALGKSYFWRIRARNNSSLSAWSKISSFSIGTNNLLKNGLIGYWPMNEGSGNRLLDQSGNNLHATIQNTTNVVWVEGKENKAIRLDGGTERYAVISHQSVLNVKNTITLSAWVKPKIMQRGHIFSKDSGNGFELWLDIDGFIEFRLNGGNSGSTYRLRSSFNYKTALNQWIHVAATFDGITSTLYINGIEDTSATYAPFDIGTTSGVLTLGARETIQRWNGDMDELRLYNRTLSSNEILMLTGQILEPSNPSSPPPTESGNLVGYWKMNEGSGSKFLDETENRNNATIINTSGVTWSLGKEGQAINLNGFGGSYGIVPHQPSLELKEELSIAAWVKPTEIGRNTIISKSAGNGFELWLDQNGFIEFRLNRGNNGSKYKLLSNFNYSQFIGQWFHVSATFDGAISRIFINGIEDISAYFEPFSIGTTSGDMVIGAMGTIQRWKGQMDEIRLYNRAITAEEIKKLVDNNPLLGLKPIQLVGHWKFDEGEGNRFIDDSGNENNATILNASGISWVAGKTGLAVDLNGFGNRFGMAPHTPNLEFQDGITISAWVKPDQLQRGTIVSKSAGNGFELWLDIDGNIEFRLNRANDGANYKLLSNYNYKKDFGKWIFISASFDGKTSKIYINGEENSSQTYQSPFSINTKSGNLVIGALGTIQRLSGSLDDLRLYDKALSNGEIKSLFLDGNLFRIGGNTTAKNSGRNYDEDQEEFISKTNSEKKLTTHKLTVYPNPFIDQIKITGLWIKNGEIQVGMYDLNGRILIEKCMKINDYQLDLDLFNQNIMPGTYMLILQDDLHRETMRLINNGK